MLRPQLVFTDERRITTMGSRHSDSMRLHRTPTLVRLIIIPLLSLLLLNRCNVPIATAASFLVGDHPPQRSHTNYHRVQFQRHPVPQLNSRQTIVALRMGFLDDLAKNVDDFIDDATNRKLGGGSTFYGERKSSFSETSKSYASVSQQEADKRDMARIGSNSKMDPLRRLRSGRLTGEQLRNLVFKQWGQRFPVLIKRKRDALGQQRLYLIIQWKYLGKRNLDLSPEEYVAESDAVAELLTEWGVANQVRNAIGESTARPKTATQQFPGLFIPLDVEKDVVETW